MKTEIFNTASGSPDSQEWHDWRGQGLGASDAPVIGAHHGMCEKPSWAMSLHQLWELKLGMREGPKENAAMRRGKEGEVEARKFYEQKTGIYMQPGFGEMDGSNFIRASFDGLALFDPLVLEIKCPSEKVHAAAKEGLVVGYYRPQLAHQALVRFGHPEGWTNDMMMHYMSYVPETQDGALVELQVLELAKEAEQLYMHHQAFWSKVLLKEPPCGQAWESVAAIWLEAHAKLKEAEAIEKQARNAVVELMGGMPRNEGYGVLCFRQERVGSVDYAKLLSTLNVDENVVAKYRKSGSVSYVVKPMSA